jgi:hypothetical protein
MKYRLAKDLPFAKKGEQIEVVEYRGIVYRTTELTFICDYLSIEDLLKDGWIEEVKPKEEYFIYNETLNNYHYKSFSSFEDAQRALYLKPTESYKYKIIKFIEVIE